MVPDFQSLMLPILKLFNNGKEHSTPEIRSSLAAILNLSESDLDQTLPSGTQKTFVNRTAWAISYLKRGCLIENTSRGKYVITSMGKELISSSIDRINIKLLRSLPGYQEIMGESKGVLEVIIENDFESTPEEILESNYLEIRKNLALNLLTRIRESSPTFFENLVVELLVKMGYGGTIQEAGERIGKSGDEGIDGIIKEDRLGLDIIYLQAKRWESMVGRPEIQKFVGALAGQGAKKGVFITTSSFTNDAKNYRPMNDTKIVLIDGQQLAELMIDYDLAVSTIKNYSLKKIDNDYFDAD